MNCQKERQSRLADTIYSPYSIFKPSPCTSNAVGVDARIVLVDVLATAVVDVLVIVALYGESIPVGLEAVRAEKASGQYVLRHQR